MNKIQIAYTVIKSAEGLAKKSDFNNAGLKDQDIYSLCKTGHIDRIKRGYYTLTSAEPPSEELILSRLLTQGVICVESALFYYGYSDFAPRKWSIAVPRSYSRTVQSLQKQVPIKAYYVQNDVIQIGKITGIFNGTKLPVYDRERTICDCFKYRTKLDSEIFNKAILAYAADQKKDLDKLSNYAKKTGVYKKMMNVMEVLLNG
ncbi:MAG: hypothetical protein HUJ63_03255 [Enterococcus sp.]|nr:hypothetical protein [Enterococcus sp.]